ncbi:MAG: glutamate--cysteine ligase [Deltaproteobacteria bacterium]|nr:glutamate--cysteine ligase [Deltaproteobacteria bacterium]
MPIQFKENLNPTLGVELELQLIDRTTKDLASMAPLILSDAAKNPNLNATAELTQGMIEIKTDICQNVKEVGQKLQNQSALIRTLADRRGVEIAIAGTHPFQHWWERKIFPDQRHLGIYEKFQWLARRLTTFGLHVHVGVRNGDRAIHIINSMINYIPHLLALSASSPFWGGRDTGLASCRTAVFESFPTGGLPYFLLDWKEFEKCYNTLLQTGAIGGIKDLYWDIRPHFDFGTVEVRICDGVPTLKETLALAALIQCLIVWIDDQFEKGKRSRKVVMPRYWLAPENKWQAARYGIEGRIINPESWQTCTIKEEIEKLLELLKPVSASLGCGKELASVSDILHVGSSSLRQRKVFQQTQSLPAVVSALISELKTNEPMLGR